MPFDEIVVEILQEQLEKRGYRLGELIGEGGFAACYKVYRIEGEYEFACKVIFADCSVLKDACEPVKETYVAEMSILKTVSHPNVLSIYNYYEFGHFKVIILEYCPNGSLHDIIKKQGHLNKKDLLTYTHQLILALNYLHSKGIAHHDIKPGNCLIDKNGRLRVADFGLAHQYGEDHGSGLRRGTMAFIAPEVSGGTYDPFKSDVWALGVTIYFMMTGKLPFHERKNVSDLRTHQMGWHCPITDTNSRTMILIIQIINMCIVFEPIKRATTAQLLEKLNEFTPTKSQNPTLPRLINKRARGTLPYVSSTLHSRNRMLHPVNSMGKIISIWNQGK